LSGYERIMAEIRNFVLREKNGKEDGVFTGHQPRQAALKALIAAKEQNQKPVELRLRERGTKKVHIFKAGQKLLQLQRTSQMDACKDQQAECKESRR